MPAPIWILGSQLCISAGNFLLSLTLARFLGLGEFGVFTLIFFAFMFCRKLLDGLILVPLTSLQKNHTENAEPFWAYAHFSVVMFCSAAVGLGLLAGLVFLPVEQCMISLFALSAIIGAEWVRRILYMLKRPVLAFSYDMARYGGLVFCMVILGLTGGLTLSRSLLVLAGVTMITSLVFGYISGAPFRRMGKEKQGIAAAHGTYVKGIAAGVSCDALSGHGPFFIAGMLLSDTQIGIIRLMHQLANLFNIPFNAINLGALPYAMTALREGGKERLSRFLGQVLCGSAGLFVLSFLGVATLFDHGIHALRLPETATAQALFWGFVVMNFVNLLRQAPTQYFQACLDTKRLQQGFFIGVYFLPMSWGFITFLGPVGIAAYGVFSSVISGLVFGVYWLKDLNAPPFQEKSFGTAFK
ncbi:MAG: lipopolysaccharide biosynthesis protein [Halocynthiibacter sp.]